MSSWDTISAHNQHINDELRRREKAHLAEAERHLHEEERPNPLVTLTEAIRQRLSKSPNSQPAAPQTHGQETVRA